MISGLFRRQRTGTTGSGFGHAVVADDADCTSVASSTPSDAAAHVDPVTPGKQQRRVTEQRSPKFKEQPRPVNMMLCCNEEKLNELLEEMLVGRTGRVITGPGSLPHSDTRHSDILIIIIIIINMSHPIRTRKEYQKRAARASGMRESIVTVVGHEIMISMFTCL